MKKKLEGDGSPANAGMKAIGWLFVMGSGAVGCGIEYALFKYAIEKSEGNGLIAYAPFVAVALIGIILGSTAIKNLNSSDLGADEKDVDLW